jgi:molybdate-binding protein
MDLGLAILEGQGRAGFAVEAVARTLKLDFVPLMWERFDLLMGRRDYFEPSVQALMRFARSDDFAVRARRLGGYDIAGLGTVHFNAP